ncbi:MAG: phenylacetate--CoA ligase, partial [Spirochaetaceae bacterium]|nr:phenylacetate--CoA ligase [Spirochaetaceae bacterium]
MIWNPEAECMPQEQRRRLQLERLKNLVETTYEKVPFYRKKLDAAGVKPKDIRSLQDIAKLPFTTKDDLRETYPLGL